MSEHQDKSMLFVEYIFVIFSFNKYHQYIYVYREYVKEYCEEIYIWIVYRFSTLRMISHS